MAQSDRIAGQGLFARFISTSGTVVLSTDYRSMDVSRSSTDIDATAGADTYEYTIPAVKKGEIKGSGVYGGTSVYYTMEPGLTGTIEWGERGTVDGYPKHSAPAHIIQNDEKNAYNGVTTVDWGVHLDGTTTNSTWSSGA